jgi:hypothetical protein
MIAKVKAEKMAISGTVRPPISRRTRADATTQKGVAATYITPQVAGLR